MTSLPSPNLHTRLSQLSLAAKLAQMRPREVVQVSAHGREVLRTPRLLIRAMTERDEREYVRAVGLSRGALDEFMPVYLEGEGEREMFARQLAHARAGDETGRDWRRLAFDMTGKLVGAVNLNDIRRGLENRAEITFWVAGDRCGQGFAKEMVAAAVDHAFAPAQAFAREEMGGGGGLGLDRVSALVSLENPASVKVLMRAGFARAIIQLPVQLSVSGKNAAHVEYRAYAKTQASARTSPAKALSELPIAVAHGIKQIVKTETASQMRVV